MKVIGCSRTPLPSLLFLFLLICLGGAFRGMAAQSQQNAPAIPSESQASATAPNNQVSTDAYRLSPEKHEKAVAYSRAGYRLYFVSVFWDITVILALLGSGVIRRLRDFAEARSGLLPVQALIFVPALFVVLALANLPLRIYWHHLSLAFQQSIQPWGSWLWDWTKGEFLTIALAIFVVIALFALIRWKPRSWWLYAWLGAIPLSLFLVFISPWYIDPLFNSFTPLQDSHPQLVQSIGELSRRAGIPIPPERMFLMRASVKTTAINAYVTGLGASKRIVIWDTSIQETKPEELLFIVGHEMGHYVLGHVVKGFAWFLSLLLIALYLAYRLLQWIIRRWGNAWGIRAQSDWAALGALLLLFNILSFLGEPIGNAISRRQEHAADVYSLELIQGLFPDANEVAAHAFQVLGEKDLSDPQPSKFITFWLYSHPPLNDRLRFAHDFRPAPQTATPNPPR
jgi:Zn-dependent protease with chaperone function